MNFLQLCQRVNAEAGLSGPGPTAVGGQVGMNGKIVAWVQAAHQDIQQKHVDWAFDWQPVSQALVAGQDRYLPADWGLAVRAWNRQGGWVYATDQGRAARQALVWLPYEQFAGLPVAAPGQAQGAPLYWSAAPDRRVCFSPVPGEGLTFEAECWLAPQVLAANADVPRLPEEYHLLIVWRALMLYCGHDENAALWQQARQNHDRLIGRMEATELPEMLGTEALA